MKTALVLLGAANTLFILRRCFGGITLSRMLGSALLAGPLSCSESDLALRPFTWPRAGVAVGSPAELADDDRRRCRVGIWPPFLATSRPKACRTASSRVGLVRSLGLKRSTIRMQITLGSFALRCLSLEFQVFGRSA